MNSNLPDIESQLRHAPQPKPPVDLKNRLLPNSPSARACSGFILPKAWWLRWWPALATGCITLICLGVVAMQQREINKLHSALEKLQAPSEQTQTTTQTPAMVPETSQQLPANGQDEIRRLRTTAKELSPEIARLESLKRENEQLRQQMPRDIASSDEFTDLAQAKAKALSIMCVNNLKQLGLAAQVWATDHRDVFPPNMEAMQPQIANPKILVCPGDTGWQPASDGSTFTAANCSYEYLAASGSVADLNRVMFRCPVHGHVVLSDSSVHQGVAKEHPEFLINRGGILYLEGEQTTAPTQPAASVPSGAVKMDPALMKRYGLTPDMLNRQDESIPSSESSLSPKPNP